MGTQDVIENVQSHAASRANHLPFTFACWVWRESMLRCLPQGPTRLMTAFSRQHDHFLRDWNLESSNRI